MAACSNAGCVTGGHAVGATVAAALQFFATSQCLLHESWPLHSDVSNGSTFDFIVVGGGTAGSTVAARLAEVSNFTVLLLEAGGDPPQESIIPGFRGSLKGSMYDWNFQTVDDHFSSQALSGGSQRQPRGKMLGGTGSLNDMVYSRGFPADYNEWASLLGDEWNWRNVLEYFKKTEHLTDENIVNDPDLMKYHGRGGPVEVAGQKESTHATARFLDAFEELGFRIVKDMTNIDVLGAGRFSHTVRSGRRDSSLTGLLNKVPSTKKLFVLKNTLVTKILLENKKAYGIEAQFEDKTLQFFVKKEVIVSAGTFNTPKILLYSGLGPKEHLENLGINVILDLPVGDNLHDHVMVMTYLAVENGTCNTNRNMQYMNMINYLFDGTGPLSHSDSMGAYISLNNSDPSFPDFAIYPNCVAAGTGVLSGCVKVLGLKNYICKKLEDENKDSDLLSLAVVLLKPKSRGIVRLNSTDLLDPPLIYSGTFSNLEDLEDFPVAIDIARSLAETSYFKSKGARVINLQLEECHGLKNEKKQKCIAKSMATSAWHAVGTAAMGSVVDARMKLNGVKNLRVVDASVMPKVTRGNTNAPVIMIAEKAADYIKKDYGFMSKRRL